MLPVLSITMPFKGQRELDLALALLTVVNVAQIRWYRLPRFYAAGLRYEREDRKQCWHPVARGCEDWLSYAQLLAQKKGDCEDLACARAADLIVHQRERARAVAIPSPGIGWHIRVRRADGSTEDPSIVLGMPSSLVAHGREVAALRLRGELR